MLKWFDSKDHVNAFLGFGYIPQKDVEPIEQIVFAKQKKINFPKEESMLVNLGVECLKKTFENSIKKYPDKTKHIIPLSGGLDSRVILGGLLDNVDKANIITITYGIPRTFDYEIGGEIAKKVGVKNYKINLDPEIFPWTEKKLLEDARKYTRPNFFFRGFNVYTYITENIDLGDEYIFWSGYLGGSLTKKKSFASISSSWDEVIESFIKKENKCSYLTSSDFKPKRILPQKPIVHKNILNYYEQMNLFVRQPYCIYPSAIFNESVEYPFSKEPYISYIINLPDVFKEDQYLYKKIIYQAYPKLFSLPTQTTGGATIFTSERIICIRKKILNMNKKLCKLLRKDKISWDVQFFDWDVELRKSKKLQDLVKKQLKDLSARDLLTWLDVESFLSEHLAKRYNHGEGIRRLVSLEIFLKRENEND